MRRKQKSHYREGGLDMWSIIIKKKSFALIFSNIIMYTSRSYVKNSKECFIR